MNNGYMLATCGRKGITITNVKYNGGLDYGGKDISGQSFSVPLVICY